MLRLLTYNLESLGERPGGPPLAARIAVLRPRLIGMAADILCLQEVDGQHPAKDQPRRPLALQRVLEGTPYADYAVAAPLGPTGVGIADRHSLITLSRLPISSMRSIRHELVAAPQLATPSGAYGAEFDRPVLYTTVALPGGRELHVINLHLRAPLAVPIADARTETGAWNATSAWATGFQLAAMKRAAQALEVRLLVDRLLDADEAALIAVCGDANATTAEVPLRILLAGPDDTGNPRLARRALVSLTDAIAAERRFSVRRHDVPALVDHILASAALAELCREVEVHNQGLVDEAAAERLGAAFLDSTHAPVLAAFDLG